MPEGVYSNDLLRRRRRTDWFVIAAIIVTLYGGLLRFEALSGMYGHDRQPRWAATLEEHLVPVARALHPETIVWHTIPVPYVGGDPINYIRYAREMRHFYQAHVREPVFLAITRGFLWLTGGRDIAVSYASLLGGTLAIFGTFLLGATACSRLVGLAAAFALAIELQAITWSADGWRDDTFMLFVTLSACSFLLLQRERSTRTGVVTGIATAAASLTRISALSFIVPAWIWIACTAPAGARRAAWKSVAISVVVWSVLAGPYLFNCWRTFGDPLYALNYHARYYRYAEGLPLDESVGALEYAGSKLMTRPISTLDTAAQGLVTVPFLNKWKGWADWSGAIGPVMTIFGALGAIAALWSPHGRLLVLILFTSLVPYALTWSVGGGGEWRFTQHVYPIYLVFACTAIAGTVSVLREVLQRRRAIHVTRQQATRAAALATAALLAWAAFMFSPLLVAREALAAGDPISITAGERDAWFFGDTWSDPIDYGNVAVRVAEAEVASIRLPLADSAYVMTLRIDPPLTADIGRQPRLTVFLNRRQLGEIDLVRDPARMGSYRLQVPKDAVKPLSRLEIMASRLVPAAEAGVPFVSLAPDTPVAFRLWYVRLEPVK